MHSPHIFSAILGLSAPWQITRIIFSDTERRFDIYIFHTTNLFSCPICGREAQIRDIHRETWHHGNFFRNSAYLHASVPEVECPHGCGCRKVPVPWERNGSRFTIVSPSQ